MKNPKHSFKMFSAAFALAGFAALAGCGGKGGSHSPVAPSPAAAGSAKVAASVDKQEAFIFEGKARVTLKCDAVAGATMVAGRCADAAGWSGLAPDGTMLCDYTAVGEYTPACVVDGAEMDETDAPVVIHDFYEGEGYKLVKQTKDVALMDYLSAPEVATNTLTFTTTDPSKVKLAAGDILFSSSAEECSTDAEGGQQGNCGVAGYLRKVTSVQVAGDTVIVQTQDAALEEMFEHAEISTDDIIAQSQRAGGRAAPIELGSGKEFSLGRLVFFLSDDFVIAESKEKDDKKDDKKKDESPVELAIKLRKGSGLSFEPRMAFKWHSEYLTLEEFLFSIGGELKLIADLDVTASVAKEFKKEKVLYTYANPALFFIGPVPIGIKFDLVAGVEVNLNMVGYITAGFDSTIYVKAGAKYTDSNGWENISDSNFVFNSHPPTFGAAASADAKLYIRPQITLTVSGTVGPMVYAEGYAAADIGISTDYGAYWDLNWGANAGLGFGINILSISIVSYYAELFAFGPYDLAASELKIVPKLEPASGELSGGKFETLLTCDVSGRPYTDILSVNARCGDADAWSDITSLSFDSKTCTYTTTGVYKPACMVKTRGSVTKNDPIAETKEKIESASMAVGAGLVADAPLTVSDVTSNSVKLNWPKSEAKKFVSYKLYMATSPGVSQSSTQAGSDMKDINTTSTTATGLEAKKLYYFKLYTCETSQCVGSKEVAATILAGLNPTILKLKSVTSTMAIITFEVKEYVTYDIYWSTKPGVTNKQEFLLNKDYTQKDLNHFDLTPSTTYYYKAYACDQYGTCTGSNELTVTTLAPPPPAVFVTLGNVTTSSANLSWTRSEAGNFASYKVSFKANGSYIFNTVMTITDRNTTSAMTTTLGGSYVVYVCDESGLMSQCAGSNEILNVFPAPEAVQLEKPFYFDNQWGKGVTLSWPRSYAVDLPSYKVYRATTPGVSQSSTFVDTVINYNRTDVLTANVSDVPTTTSHYFKVYACDRWAHCTGSNEVSLLIGTCGNNIVEFGETCDDGNTTTETETCAYGEKICVVCNSTCRSDQVVGNYCGDYFIDANNGETCDDGNTRNGDGCTSTCRSTQTIYGSHEYRTVTTLYTRQNAKNNCASLGGYLVTIDTAAEADFIYTNLATQGGNYYIGYNDINSEGNFVWDNGSVSTYTNWAAGEPGVEDCVHFVTSTNNKWSDYPCSGYSYSICEIDPIPVCGNGTVESGETCDDGNATTETCAYGQTSCTVCNATCQSVAGATSYCGDGVTNSANGETCDDGNTTSGDGCSSTCQTEAGPAIYGSHEYRSVTTAYSWQDAKNNCASFGGYLATINDAAERDFIYSNLAQQGQKYYIGYNDINSEGNFVWDNGSASTYTNWLPGEPNNWGNSENCVIFGYANDNRWSDYPCTGYNSYSICEIESSVCGNGATESGETCDDGNTTTETCTYGQTSCTVCNSACQSVAGAVTGYCGDSAVNGTETCDDGNTTTETCAYGQTSCAVCNATCQSVAGTTSYCGNGVTNSANGETCDDGNTTTETCAYGQTSCAVCNATCQSAAGATSYCGDGTINGSETCDDGNTNSGDGCSAACQTEAVTTVTYGGHEYQRITTQYSWSNAQTNCQSLGGYLWVIDDSAENNYVYSNLGQSGQWYYTGYSDSASEGNFVWVNGSGATYTSWASGEPNNYGGTEDCALIGYFGNSTWTDGNCEPVEYSICEKVSAVCGNSAVESGETCDDGNTTAGDGCSATCKLEGTVFTYGGHEYLHASAAATWCAARDNCAAAGGYLVTIDGAAENTAVYDNAGGHYWIGYYQNFPGVDYPGDVNTNWLWANGSSSYTNWASGEPNDWNGSNGGEDCGMAGYNGAYVWNDFPCQCVDSGQGSYVKLYVCETDSTGTF